MNSAGFIATIKTIFSALRKIRRALWKIRKTISFLLLLLFVVVIGLLLYKTKAAYGNLAPESIVGEAESLLKAGFNKKLPDIIYSSDKGNEPDYYEKLLNGKLYEKEKDITDLLKKPRKLTYTDSIPEGDNLIIRFLDVDQGDATLVTKGSRAVLIDTGEYDQLDRLREYLKEAGVSRLDAVIGTHPHSDHIGSLATIIREYKPATLYIPDVTANTVSYDMMISDAMSNGTGIVTVCAGDIMEFDGIQMEVLAPAKRGEYEDLNNYSIVIKIRYGQRSCIIAADAQEISEAEMLSSGKELSADVLRVGHHGSESSTTEEFLAAVDPAAAVISVGEGNEFGHPHKKTMKTLEKSSATILRTDQNGTVTAIFDGSNILWHIERGGDS